MEIMDRKGPEADVLEQEKKAVADIIAIKPITRDNAVFRRTEGGFVSLEYDGKQYARVAVHRCFPFSDPTGTYPSGSRRTTGGKSA